MEDLRPDIQFLNAELQSLSADLMAFHDRYSHLITDEEMKGELHSIIGLPLVTCSHCDHEYYQLATDMVCERCFWRRLGLH